MKFKTKEDVLSGTNSEKKNSVKMQVISQGNSLKSINLLYSSCSHSQNNRPTTN